MRLLCVPWEMYRTTGKNSVNRVGGWQQFFEKIFSWASAAWACLGPLWSHKRQWKEVKGKDSHFCYVRIITLKSTSGLLLYSWLFSNGPFEWSSNCCCFLLLNGIKVCILNETVYILPQCAGNKGGSKQATRDWKMRLLQTRRKWHVD